MAKRLFSFRVWVLIFAVLLSILAINPSPWAEGVQVKSVVENSPLALAGLLPGEMIESINREPINSLSDVKAALDLLTFTPITLAITTDKGSVSHTFLDDPGFVYNQNVTITDVIIESELKKGMIIESINGQVISSDEDIQTILDNLITKEKFFLTTKTNEYAVLLSKPPQFEVTAEQGAGNTDIYNLERDTDKGKGYRCGIIRTIKSYYLFLLL